MATSTLSTTFRHARTLLGSPAVSMIRGRTRMASASPFQSSGYACLAPLPRTSPTTPPLSQPPNPSLPTGSRPPRASSPTPSRKTKPRPLQPATTERQLWSLLDTIRSSLLHRRSTALAPHPTRAIHALLHLPLPTLASLPSQHCFAALPRRAMILALRQPGGERLARELAERFVEAGVKLPPRMVSVFLKRVLRSMEDPTTLLAPPGLAYSLKLKLQASQTELINLSLSLSTTIDFPLLTQLLALHIAAGTPITEIYDILSRCLAHQGYEKEEDWPAEAFGVMMMGYQRRSDKKGLGRWYTAWRESRTCRDRRAEGVEGSSGVGSGIDGWAAMVKEGKKGLEQGDGISWPYLTMIRASSLGLTQHHLTSSTTALVLQHMQEDNVLPPISLLNEMLEVRRANSDFRGAMKVWRTMEALAGLEAGARPNLESFEKLLGVMRLPRNQKSSESVDQKEPGLREIVRRVFGPSRRSDAIFPFLAPPSIAQNFLNALLRTSLSRLYFDLPLALWTLKQFRFYGVKMEDDTVDLVAEGVVGYWRHVGRNAVVGEEIFGREAMVRLGRREEDVKGFTRRRGASRSGWVRKPESRLTEALWEMVTGKIVDLQQGWLANRANRLEADISSKKSSSKQALLDLAATRKVPPFITTAVADLTSVGRAGGLGDAFVGIYGDNRKVNELRHVSLTGAVMELMETCVVAQERREARKGLKDGEGVELEKMESVRGEVLERLMRGLKMELFGLEVDESKSIVVASQGKENHGEVTLLTTYM